MNIKWDQMLTIVCFTNFFYYQQLANYVYPFLCSKLNHFHLLLNSNIFLENWVYTNIANIICIKKSWVYPTCLV